MTVSDRDNRKQLGSRVDPELLHLLRVEAAKRNTSVTVLVNEALTKMFGDLMEDGNAKQAAVCVHCEHEAEAPAAKQVRRPRGRPRKIREPSVTAPAA